MIRILIFGDIPGIPQLLSHLPKENVVGIVGASIRSQYFEELKRLAEKINVPFLVQPKWKSKSYDDFKEEVLNLNIDLIWVNSYSMIIRDDVLNLPRLGGLNIHAALLPRNRGSNPTQWAIINGDFETGVTLHEIDSGIDTGPIIDQRKVPIYFEDSWIDVRDRLSKVTDELIQINCDKILTGNWVSNSQDKDQATVWHRRTPADSEFSWADPVIEIYNKVRALLPPLPPAFYLDQAGQKQALDSYQTIWQLTTQKYNPYGCSGGGGMLSDQVRLRALRKEDAKLLYEWIVDRELVILNSPYHPVSETDHEAWVERMMKKSSDLVIFVIEEVMSSTPIGTCQLLNINWRHRSAELQIRIGDSSHQGKGYGSEAVQLLIEFGFKDLNLHRIYLHVFAANKRAIRVYEKCGFRKEGILKEAAFIDGEWVDVIVMGLLNSN